MAVEAMAAKVRLVNLASVDARLRWVAGSLRYTVY